MDIFRFFVSKPNLNKITKRSVLSVVAKLYDPVGWISPVIVRGKLFIQQLWKKDLQWDELLPAKDAEDWTSYIDELRFVSDVTIPRWIGLDPYALHSELHGFCDASERAYGSVIYLRVADNFGRISVTLLTSKTKVAPIKQLSISRLQLQAAVLLARLITACRQVRALAELPYQCWTDSSIVLCWCAKYASQWKTFVANRVSEVQTLLQIISGGIRLQRVILLNLRHVVVHRKSCWVLSCGGRARNGSH